jgi:transcriptional regulator with GAF, ATPase, and Fis domain
MMPDEGQQGSLARLKKALAIYRRLGDSEGVKRVEEEMKRLKLGERIISPEVPLPTEPGELATLYLVSQTINSILDLRGLLEKVMDLALKTLGTERGLLFLLDSDGRPQVEVAVNTDPETEADATGYSRHIIEEAVRGGRAILSSDAQSDERFKDLKSVRKYKIISFMCVPMRLKEKVIGTIYVDHRKLKQRCTERNLTFLEAFANLAAIAIENARLHESMEQENIRLRERVQEIPHLEEMVGSSPAVLDLFRLVRGVAADDVKVLILGESGTGKRLIARALHDLSPRRENAFVSIDFGVLSGDVVRSELFGHARGAFTDARQAKEGLLEEAHEGTVFLDEIDKMDERTRSMLLEFLDTGKFRRMGETKERKADVRLISASNRNLEQDARDGRFPSELLYRLNVVTIRVPPLRERTEDIPLLAEHFIDLCSRERKRVITGITEDAMRVLEAYHWQENNVRELQNEIERAVVLTPSNEPIRSEVLSDKVRSIVHPDMSGGELSLKQMQESVRITVLKEALSRSRGNVSQAARELGITRKTLYSWIERYGIDMGRG